MAWIESHQALGRHPKTKRLARLLDCSLPTAVGHLHFLWWWAVDFAQDGDVSGYDCLEIADAALWEGDAEHFRAALVATGFLDADAGTLHDWHEYAGRLIEQREKAKERTRAWREQHKPAAQPKPAPVTHNERITYGATVPNLTVPDHTLTTASAVVAPAEPVAVPTPPAARPARPVPKPKERDQSWIERHPLFPALVAIPEIGRPAGDRWSLYGKALKTLDELGATPEQVPRCAENYPLVMGTKADGTPIPLTLTGLMNNWNLCKQAPVIRRQGGNRVDDLGPTQDDRRRAEERQRADAAAYRAALGLNGAGAASELVAGRLSRLPRDGGP